VPLAVLPVAHVREVTSHGSSGGHCGADQMRASVAALTAFKVAIAGGGATLARLQHVRIHGQAHRAPRLAPLESGSGEDVMQTFFFGLCFYLLRTRNHHRLYPRIHVITLDHLGSRAQIFNPRVGARSYKNTI